ncbi:dicarboxylate transporter/tellurite-resistance protein TehA [Rhodoplanes elegans]|uniref:Dicarboxylate transporter/tellurite-resistance protein TehA n=1 Tax=Rhodoplanes elegans TaxID=29408 RepID=A0A327KXC6_9BRAD|nr:dicarboxylate transporter/tellurite-resistance protein TehA [Rhodoplanes elegans]MBK5959244.1 dicarboxylate transporter/tellurite-resistance protein TehA [Rhodoplanes elegans]RAI42175.1 dicarboxylate transporter/tellurite-resistance protein TehA [Rhodoplanes elegans]
MSGPRSLVSRVPASFFGMVLGLVGLGSAWRAAHQVWGLPAVVGEALMLAGGLVWAVLVVLFAAKWLVTPDDAAAEARHPVQCCFIGLAGVATMLVGIALEPYARPAALAMFTVGAAFTLAFGLWRTGVLWQGARDPAASTPVLYLPTVAGSSVMAIGLSALGHPEWGRLCFGAGVLSWLAIESVLLFRLYTAPEMPVPLRPTLGIQLAPPTVGATAYLSVTSGPPDLIAFVLVGYGLVQLLLLVRLSRWIFAGGVGASAWGVTFGLTALAGTMVRLVGRGDTGPMAVLAPGVLTLVTIAIAGLALRTLWLLVAGRLLPPATPTVPAAAAVPLAGTR